MKKIGLTISFIVIILFAVGFGISKYESTNTNAEKEDNTIYTMQEVLSSDVYTANFDVEEKSLVVSTKHLDENSKDLILLTELTISEEDEQELINEIEQFKLIKYNVSDIMEALKTDSYYSLYLTISTGYRLTLNSKNKTLYVLDENIAQGYTIQNGHKFFALLEKIKEAPAK